MDDHKEPKEDFSFLQETIKDKKSKYLSPRAILRISILGIVFGLFACTSFVILKPFLESFIGDEPQTISIPEDDFVSEEDLEATLEDGEAEPLAIADFENLYDQLYEVAGESIKSLVSIHDKTEESSIESVDIQVSTTGIQIAATSEELLILSPIHGLDTEQLSVNFHDGLEVEASIKSKDTQLGFMVLSVNREAINNEDIHLATLGNSNTVRQGDIIVSIGNQFEYDDGLGYGIVSSTQNVLHIIDGELNLIATDIPVSQTGTGVLINTHGEIIGIVNAALTSTTTEAAETTISAIAISCLKEPMENMSNGLANPYLGIKGIEITEEIIASEGLPEGIYVQEVVVDSPAMTAGIRSGDIIYQLGSTKVLTQQLYRSELLDLSPGEVVELKAKRLGSEGYVDVAFEVKIGKSE